MLNRLRYFLQSFKQKMTRSSPRNDHIVSKGARCNCHNSFNCQNSKKTVRVSDIFPKQELVKIEEEVLIPPKTKKIIKKRTPRQTSMIQILQRQLEEREMQLSTMQREKNWNEEMKDINNNLIVELARQNLDIGEEIYQTKLKVEDLTQELTRKHRDTIILRDKLMRCQRCVVAKKQRIRKMESKIRALRSWFEDAQEEIYQLKQENQTLRLMITTDSLEL